MGSLVAGAAARAEDIYWNVTRPEQKEAEKAFAQLIKEKKAKYNAAVSSGTALRSKLMSGANVLLNTEGFEGQSPEDLAATIQMVKDAGLAKSHPEAVKYILENRDNYTIKKPKVKDTETTEVGDASAQTTSMLTGGGGKAPPTPPKENRGVLTRMLHGESERTIQDSVLKSMNMTREEFNALSSPPVMKKLNIGESVIKLAVKKKTNPIEEAFILDRGKATLKVASELKYGTPTNITNSDGNNMTVGEASQEFLEILDEDPNSKRAVEIETKLTSMLLDRNSIGTLSKTLEPVLESAIKFINNKEQNFVKKAEARETYNILTTLLAKAGSANISPMELSEIRQEIQTTKANLKLIIGREVDEINPELTVMVDTMDTVMNTLNPNQVLSNGKTALQTRSDIKLRVMKLTKNLPNMSREAIAKETEELEKLLINFNSTLPVTVGTNLEENHADILAAMDDNKISGNIQIPNPENTSELISIPAIDFYLNNYGPLFASLKAGQKVPEEDILTFQTQLLSRVKSDEDEERVDGLKRFQDVVDNSESTGTVSQVKAKLLNGDLTPTQEKLTQEIFTILTEKSNKVRLLHHETNPDGTYKYNNLELDRLYTDYAIERATLIDFLGQAAAFTNETYDADVNAMKTQVRNVENILQTNSNVFSLGEHKEIMDLASRFSSLARTPMAVTGEDAEAKNEEIIEQLGEITAKLIVLGRRANLPEPTSLDEKVEAIVELEKLRNINMTDAQEKYARVLIRGLLAQGNLISTKDGIFMRNFNAETGNVELIRVPPLTGERNPITMKDDELELNKASIKTSLMGEATTGRILKTFMNNSNAFNFVGSAQLFGVNASDLFNSLTGADTKPFLGSDRIKLADVQRAKSDAFTLIKNARQQLFGSDSRLSDLDLRTLNSFLVVLESNNFSLVGTTRGQAALGIIQAAMTKDAMIRAKDADFDNKLTISEAFEAQTEAEITNMSKEQELIYEYEKKLGFKIGPDSGESLAKTAFWRVLQGYGVPKFASREEGLAMNEQQRNLYKHKINFAIQQMQFVMSDIYVYVATGKDDKDNVVNQMLQNYKDFE